MDGGKIRRNVCLLLLAAAAGFPGIYQENLEKARINAEREAAAQAAALSAVPLPWQQGLFTPASGDPGTLLRSGTLTEGGAEGGGSAPAMTEGGGTLLTDANRVSGLALVSAAAASPGWEAPPAWASAHGPWQACGVNRDFFGILLTDGPAPEHCPWDAAAFPPFPVGTNLHTRLFVSSCGAVSFGSPARLWPDGRPVPDGSDAPLFAPLLGNLGVAPPEGAFWHGVSPSNTLLLTWRDVHLNRDSNLAASAQCELRPSGDFALRVRLPEGADPSGFATAVQNAGGGEAFPWDSDTLALARSPGGVEIRGRGFGALPPGGDDGTDTDGDGLTDAEEIFIWGTDPRLPDTDFDGLSDAGETAAGTDPRAPDSDGDGLADGIDPDPLVWDDPDGDAGNDGLGYLFEVIHGLDPAADNALDSDGDGWADWKELMAGTDPDDMSSVPVNIDGIQTQVPALFEATVTLNASLPCDALLRVGGRTVVLRQARSHTLTLVEGVAYPVSVAASLPCAVSLSATLSSPYAAFQNPGGVFSGGAAVPGGAPVACGMIAQPRLGILPERVCFHSGAPKTVAAKVSPPMAGSYRWDWYGGGISSVTGRSANISWDGGDSPVCLSFTASGAAQPRCGHREVTRCAKAGEDTWCDDHGCEHWYCACDNGDASGDDDCGFHGQKVSACREAVCPTHGCPYDGCPDGWCHRHGTWYSDCGGWWCHMHDRPLSECGHDETPGGDPGTGGETAAPGEPVFGSGDLSLAAVNNDDDDASGAEDSGEAPVAGENDLAAVWPLGHFDGQCCPCPEHRVPPEGSQSAELESCSARLALHTDAIKTDAFGATVGAGQAVWVEGLSASPSVGADRVVWKWTDGDSHVHRVTNAFTVLSVRLFGDTDLDGDVDAGDKALHPALSRETGWAVPAAPGVLRPVRLRTDVGLSGGAYTLTLAGTPGAFRIWPDASGTNAPLLGCGQTVTNGAGGVSFLAGPDTGLHVEAVSNGVATLTYAFAGDGEAEGLACSATLKMTAYRVTLEPVTADANAQGLILNPCGVAANGLAAYRLTAEPAAAFPEESIHWSVAYGGVTFYGGNNTGREAIIRGGISESDFKLEIQIDGLPETCRPYIHGRVLEPKTVPVRAYVICDSNDVAAVSADTIAGWVAEANRIYRQVAMTFTLASVQNVYGKDKWFVIENPAEFYEMTSYTNNTGGLELYCVGGMYAPGAHSSMQLTAGDIKRGMAIRQGEPGGVLAHELGHACGLDHIYYALGGMVSLELLLEANWSGGDGTGHYPPDLEHQNLVSRVLMYPYKVNSAQDIPLGSVKGSENVGGTVIVSPKPCGFADMVTREPTH